MPPVYCYHEYCPGIPADPALLQQWAASWRYYGWEPKILTRHDAEAVCRTAVQEILASEELGRGNLPAGYCHATHIQWAAMAAHPDALKVDFDIICNGFTPAMLEKAIAECGTAKPIFLNACNCNCAVYLPKGTENHLIAAIFEHSRDPQPVGELAQVCHDQAVFGRYQDRWSYPPQSYVTEYSVGDWRSAPLIHFNNAKARSPRSRIVAQCGFKQLL